jgi:pimeloyl-ACP methyl ester carboxylesterase
MLVGMPAPRTVQAAVASSKRAMRAFTGSLVSDAALESRQQRDSLMAEAGHPAALRGLWENRHHWREFESYASQIPARVLFLSGDQDPLSSESDNRDMAAMLPNAKVRMLSGIGHAAPLETAVAVADTIAECCLAGR